MRFIKKKPYITLKDRLKGYRYLVGQEVVIDWDSWSETDAWDECCSPVSDCEQYRYVLRLNWCDTSNHVSVLVCTSADWESNNNDYIYVPALYVSLLPVVRSIRT